MRAAAFAFPRFAVLVRSRAAAARLGGMKVGVITKRISETVAMRARDLKLEFVYQGQAFKMQAVREIAEKAGVTLDEIAYVGDDVIDLPVMRECRPGGGRGQCAGAGEG
jgi:3-deoxy-D-manno-octulosonate 8-phosphate phosphatase (KDO 8-P phosphatase)